MIRFGEGEPGISVYIYFDPNPILLNIPPHILGNENSRTPDRVKPMHSRKINKST